jgi:arginine decarboxylase-like protein
MKTKVNEKTENAIIVQGVVLTDKAVEMLKGLQNDDNSLIKADRDDIGDAICNMLQLLDASDQESFKEKINKSVIALTYVREHLEDLQKP